MATDAEIRRKFWKALNSDMTMFLGLAEGEDGHARPMTAQLDDELDVDGDYHGPLWFFTATDNNLYRMIQQAELDGGSPRAMAHFASKGHDVWATVHGQLSTTRDRATIDRLWNRFVAAWYEGKDDPKIALIRLDAEEAEIWVDASSLVAGIKMLIGIDPKQDYKDKVAEVRL
ncbi:MAG: pyridoxamine 5'-phosphate oxidase family protein [Erythrobacter sp.]|uniref:pyridoxamine 5'-phosphate oxidase family protein n=1 Tax=Erythrobacter sp. TaxID=1042 RepID=UPI0025FF2FA0|nr:pyridoxamine 5'-phosphate oxidase family protein [Erythrobacter sp.]MCL9997876.1 pyridoxamine 5'-phosphate oxidase family protein [Erythrobacter sp.]